MMADDGDCEGFWEHQHDKYETKPSPVSAVSNCNSQKPVIRTTPPRDMYWFAQTSEPAMDNSPQMKNSPLNKKEDSYWFAHGGISDMSVSVPFNDSDGSKDSLLQKEREERIRLFKEQQEEERQKRQQELEQSFTVAKKYREQQEAERRRKIEEARIREDERRQQVEERKRQIWEAEQERKEAILRRNLEREARIEARRNAQRNSMSFAFGSSTPRTFDLDLAALGAGRGPAQGSVLMSAVSGRRSEEREFGGKRATSACSLDRKYDAEDLMSRSMVSLSSVSRGRRRTDLTPTVPRDRSTTPILTSRGKQSMRAVSMTRLDQLAQPRRRYAESPKDSTTNSSPTKSRMTLSSMSKSMCNLVDSNLNSHSSRLAVHTSSATNDNSMSRSMMHLPEPVPRRGRTASPRPSPAPPKPTSPRPALRSAQSMTHLAITPRPTRATRLRAHAMANAKDGHTTSMLNICKSEFYANGRLMQSVMKDNSHSPSRPQSSMSRSSEISTTSSQASGVMLRPKPAPRRPRPVSIAGTTLAGASAATPPIANKRPERPTRPIEKTVPKTARARSAEPDQNNEESATPRSAPKKPVPPPKTSEILAKAKSRPVPSKDNLRKLVTSAEPAKKSATKDSQLKNVLAEKQEIKIQPSSEADKENIPSPDHEVKLLLSSEPEMNLSSETEIKDLSSSEPDAENSHPLEAETKISLMKSESESLSVSETQVVPGSEVSAAGDEEDAAEKFAVTSPLNNQSTAGSVDHPEQKEPSEKPGEQPADATPLKPRITSEEEAKAALAEKRRLAREQAEREAELERQRQEELKRQEEERQRQEELEQKRLEEEQLRLAELHRKLEEEKLRKAIEEQQQREKEEREKKEEEARLKAEKEEQERRAREEAERQKLELEERLRKEEEERAERKRRVEQIMSRTRAKTNQTSSQVNSQNASKPTTPAEENKPSPPSDNLPVLDNATSALLQPESGAVLTNHNDTVGNKCIDVTLAVHENNISNSADSISNTQTVVLQPHSDNSISNHVDQQQNLKQGPVLENGHHLESAEFLFEETNLTHSLNRTSNRTSECIDISLVAQTNGYSSHEEMSCTTSPEEKSEISDASGVVLVDVISQPCLAVQNEQSEFDQLIDLGQVEQSSNSHLDNYLMSSDDLNSNIIPPGKPFIAFEDNVSKKQETSVTDLLS